MVEPGEENRIAKLFENKTLLITGGSGFLGKVLIEKLLRSCTNLKKIFVLVRTKKGKNPQERLQEILNGPLFDLVREQFGKNIFEKLEAISADVTVSTLGLSQEDHGKIVAETEIIYHSAATIKFDEVFETAVLINVRGTKLLLELAKECKKLQAFVHLSTAYCHEDQDVLEEKTYAPCANPHKVIEMCEALNTDLTSEIKKKILGPHANTYTFTKALGESIVEEQMNHLPVIILRPAAVLPIWREPLPGWTDNINGPMGLLIGAGKGVIRTMYGKGDSFTDFVPVDITVNGLIVCVYDYITNRTRRIYNITASDELKITNQEIIDLGKSILTSDVPFNSMLWYPGGSLKKFKIHHYFDLVLFQIAPAVLLDTILFVLRIKPCFIRIQKRIIKGYDIFEYYVSRKWNFDKTHIIMIRDTLLNAKEKEIFKIDSKNFNFRDYFTDCIIGARRYILKEPDDTLPMAKTRMKMMWFLDRVCKFLLIIGFIYFLYKTVLKSLLY